MCITCVCATGSAGACDALTTTLGDDEEWVCPDCAHEIATVVKGGAEQYAAPVRLDGPGRASSTAADDVNDDNGDDVDDDDNDTGGGAA